MSSQRAWTLRQWAVAGALAWLAVTGFYIVVFGLRRVTSGLVFYPSWHQVWVHVGVFAIGALLSPLVLAAFLRMRAAGAKGSWLVAGYVATGIVYWVTWSFLASAALPPPGAADLTEALIRRLALSALVILTLYTVMVMLFEAHWYLREARREAMRAAALEADLSYARSAGLQARLNPGLVFTALGAASSLMQEDRRAARKLIADLSELLRVSLGRDGHQLIPLADEIALLRRYLAIRGAGEAKPPDVRLAAPAEVLSWPVPPLLLMPVVDDVLNRHPARVAAIRLTAREGEDHRLSLELGFAPAVPAMDWQVAANRVMAETAGRLLATCGAGAAVAARRLETGDLRIEIGVPARYHPSNGELTCPQ